LNNKTYPIEMREIKWICLVFAILLSLGSLMAQPPDGGTFEDPDAAIPIDGGVGFLTAGGIAYGIKKLRDYNKRK